MIVGQVHGEYPREKNPFDRGQAYVTYPNEEAMTSISRRLHLARNDHYGQRPTRGSARIAQDKKPLTVKWAKATAALQSLLTEYMRTNEKHYKAILNVREKSGILLRAIRRIVVVAQDGVVGVELAPITNAQDMVAILKALLKGHVAQGSLCRAIQAYGKEYLRPDIEIKHISWSKDSPSGLLVELSPSAVCVSLKRVGGNSAHISCRTTPKSKTFLARTFVLPSGNRLRLKPLLFDRTAR